MCTRARTSARVAAVERCRERWRLRAMAAERRACMAVQSMRASIGAAAPSGMSSGSAASTRPASSSAPGSQGLILYGIFSLYFCNCRLFC